MRKKIDVLKKGVLSSILFLSLSLTGQNQPDPTVFENHGGIEISITDLTLLDDVLAHPDITLDHGCRHHVAKLYAGKEGYEYLIETHIPFIYHPRPIPKVTMKGIDEIFSLRKSGNCMEDINFYPTYDAYVSMMYDFADRYPDICKVFSIGTLSSGREILVAQIGDNIEINEKEPNFLYTSTMHGDETAGFPMMLQLIDLLTCEYDSDPRIKNLVDNINIYINPLANPDGTYTDDNSTVRGATRRNSNVVDLNRNFPDPEDGLNPDNKPYQEETLAFMEFADKFNIHMSCNFHGGAEVVSYPWDTYRQAPADVEWWLRVSHEYANSCQANGPQRYMSEFDDGVTNGFAWYEVRGGRQDHMTYFHRGRELTLELSNVKLVDSESLPIFWNANKSALLSYIEEALYGLHGIITDCNTGQPIKAEILIPGFDIDNSSVFSDSLQGDFYRFLEAGNYMVQIIAAGYETLEVNVEITNKIMTTLPDLELCLGVSSTENIDDDIRIIQTAGQIIINTDAQRIQKISLLEISGKTVSSARTNQLNLPSGILPGIYILRYSHDNKSISKKIYIPE